MAEPFIVYGLPRSRTAWLAAFLTYRDWRCGHEEAVNMRSMADVRGFFAQPRTGAVETGAAQGWWLIRHHVPNIRMAVIRRPVAQVVESMMAVDVAGVATYDEEKLWRIMRYGERMLAQISAQPGVLTVEFDELAEVQGCAALFEHCLPYPFDAAWWHDMRDQDIQVDVKAFLLRYFANREAVEKFKIECRSELRNLCRAGIALRAA